MDQQLKQRLVGLTVIFSLAVIFLPMLLDGSGTRIRDLTVEIPPPPELTLGVNVEKKTQQLDQAAAKIKPLEPLNVDEWTPVAADEEAAEAPLSATSTQQSDKPKIDTAKTDADRSEKPQPAKPADKPKAETEKVAAAPQKSSSSKPSPAKIESAASKKSEKPAKKPVGGDSWVVQTGSYADRQKALKQRDKLRASRIAAVFIEQFDHQRKVRYRVRLGPFVSRDKARVAQNKLIAKYNIQGLVMRYEK